MAKTLYSMDLRSSAATAFRHEPVEVAVAEHKAVEVAAERKVVVVVKAVAVAVAHKVDNKEADNNEVKARGDEAALVLT